MIQYALTLMRWLALEGGRRNSAEELWSDLVLALQRLGYASAKLALADGQRIWEQADGCLATHRVVQELQGGRLGKLELNAFVCATGDAPIEGAQPCLNVLLPLCRGSAGV